VSIPLWPHQQAAVDKLGAIGGGFLWFDMGAGKSRAALALAHERWDATTALILCPKSVVAVWPGEFDKCGLSSEWDVLALDNGRVADREQAIRTGRACAQVDGKRLAVVLNYEAVIAGEMEQTLTDLGWDLLVCDESHKLKDTAGKQSLVVSHIAKRCSHRLGLTGTPMPRCPLDVYGQFRAICPGVLGWKAAAFRNRYATVQMKFRWVTQDGKRIKREYPEIVGYQRIPELQERMAPYCCRVRSEEVLDLPDTVDLVRYCTLGTDTARAYKEMETTLRVKARRGELRAQNGLVQLLRLAQIANGFLPDPLGGPDWIGREKASLLEDLLDDLAPDEPLVVFGRFHPDLDQIHHTAQKAGRNTAELSGRRNELAAWQAPDGPEVLAVQLQAGGLGVDLTRARYCVYYALDWSLGDYLQTRKRVHRHGQTRNVTYIHLLARGTVDEIVLRALQRREETLGAIVDALRH
jgi:SNF2 family DNA or RNA helicase